MGAYKFSSCAREEKPDNDQTRLLEKAQSGALLTREEKDRIASLLYGLFSVHGATYKLAGWAWSMSGCLRRILVNYKYDRQFEPYYAPDKTSLRKALCLPISEMVYA
ncbi:hypothetical protein ES703_118874 [subsurface metagenome]